MNEIELLISKGWMTSDRNLTQEGADAIGKDAIGSEDGVGQYVAYRRSLWDQLVNLALGSQPELANQNESRPTPHQAHLAHLDRKRRNFRDIG